jgi:putative phosphoribosyl transferase
MPRTHTEPEIEIAFDDLHVRGELMIPPEAVGVVLFAHGSGSSRHSPRNQFVASILRQHGVGTLLFDLLTEDEEERDRYTGSLRFDIPLLARRLLGATRWQHKNDPGRLIGYFGSSTGAGAALLAEAQSEIPIHAIVSRGGRPDLAGGALPVVKAPTLLIVGALDTTVIQLNRDALAKLTCSEELRIVPGATHLFEEPGALEQVADMAANWFELHFKAV